MPEPGDAVVAAVHRGGRTLEARASRLGEDLVVAVGGGERPHVGCAVLAVSRPSTANPSQRSVSTSVLTLPPHKEEGIARPIAEHLARVLGGVVVVAAGVHDDDLGPAGIADYLTLAQELARRLADELAG